MCDRVGSARPSAPPRRRRRQRAHHRHLAHTHDVDAAGLGDDAIDDGVHLLHVGDVELEQRAGRLEVLHGLETPRARKHAAAELGVLDAQRVADATRAAARDQHDGRRVLARNGGHGSLSVASSRCGETT